MPKRSANQPLPPAAAPAPLATRPVSLATAIERCALLQLRNPFLWLAAAIPLYLSLYLTFLQWRYQALEHLELMSHLTMLIEAGTLSAALILAAGTTALRQAWVKRYPESTYRELAAHLAAVLVIFIIAILELLPTLIFHQYPQLKSAELETQINIPLMMLQRSILLVLMCMITYNVVIILRYYVRLSAALATLIGLAWHIWWGYYLTYLSFTSASFITLNDVFYYNQLWHYIDGFPKLQAKVVFHNMQWSIFAYYAVGLVIWLASLLLMLPKAADNSTAPSRKTSSAA